MRDWSSITVRFDFAGPRQWTARGIRAALLPVCFAFLSGSPAVSVEAGAKIKIAFAGDSIVDNYWAGITRVVDADACLKNTLELGRFARNGTGLSRGDRLYWPREIKRIDNLFRPTLSVLSIGLNDRQFIVDEAGVRTAWGAPNWSDRYRHEINEFLTAATANKAIVLMVGMPVMRDGVDNTDAIEKNSMFTAAIQDIGAPNLRYVEPWRLKDSGLDIFASYAHDKNGKLVQVRSPDGQHFTSAGEDMVATYLFPKIEEALRDAGINLDQCSNRQIKAEQH
jgi:hypothetical protein